MDLKDGRVVIRMLPNIAPKHVARIKELVRSGFYDGLTFHRVIKNFIVQGGDPTGTGNGGSGQKILAEFTSKYSHKRKVVSMARQTDDPNSADSQFFIVTSDSTFLDGHYTIWGYVVSGMEFVDNIKQGDVLDNGIVSNPDKIVKMSIAMDVENENKERLKNDTIEAEKKLIENKDEIKTANDYNDNGNDRNDGNSNLEDKQNTNKENKSKDNGTKQQEIVKSK